MNTAKKIGLLSLLAALLVAAPCQGETVHALLIGVTEYPNLKLKLGDRVELLGPAQDVVVFRQLLRGKNFEVPARNIIVLAQSEGPKYHPTRANIEREYLALVERVAPGDHVVILHAGHGSQDVDDDPNNKADPEVDGLDELFLPSDAKNWNGGIGHVENGIRDDEIRVWLAAIQEAGASVFFISDSCNSESQTRGPSAAEQKSRGVQLVPKRIRSRVDRRISTSRGDSFSDEKPDKISRNGIVAFYAASSGQPTPDGFSDPETGEDRNLGLLVFTINRILRATKERITYRELWHRVQSEYKRYDCATSGSGGYHYVAPNIPNPVVEGTDLDREVLGNSWRPDRSRIRFSRKQDLLYLTCSRLDGTMPGTILKLFPQAGENNSDKQIGWAKISEAGMDECIAVPVEYSKSANEWREVSDASTILARGRCEIHSHDFGILRIQLSLDASAEVPEVRKAVDALSTGETNYLEIRESGSAPFRLLVESDERTQVPQKQLVLERAVESSGVPLVSRFDLGPVDNRTEDRLKVACKKILKTKALRETAYDMQLSSGSSGNSRELNVEVTIEALDRKDSLEGTPVATGVISKGNFVRFKLVNRSRSPVRVTALYLGDDFKIATLFPTNGENNLLSSDPGNPSSFVSRVYPVVNVTKAMENLVVFATPDHKAKSTEFSFLAQSPIRGLWLDSVRASRGRKGTLEKDRLVGLPEPVSPLAKMLEANYFKAGATRSGIGEAVVPACKMSVVSWHVVEERRLRDLKNTSAAQRQFDAISLHRGSDEWQPSVAQFASRGIGQSVYPKVAPTVVVVRCGGGHGTGSFISDDGWILTNHHVVEDCDVDPVTGTYAVDIHYGEMDGKWMKLADQPIVADVYRWSEEKDLALLKLRELPESEKKLPFLKLATESAGPGADCIAIGHPASGVLWTLRTGEVSGVAVWPRDRIDAVIAQMSLTGSDRTDMRDQLSKVPQRDVLLSTCGLNPGDSGGPLVNESGELVAVSFAIPLLDLDRGVSLDKFSYHVNLSEIKEFIHDMPGEPLQQQPNIWSSAGSFRAQDFDSNGRNDTLVLGGFSDGESTTLIFDLDENSSSVSLTDNMSAQDMQKLWDAEFAIQIGESAATYYDTDDDGQFDLYLVDQDHDGTADQRKRFANEKWSNEPLPEHPVKMLDVSHLGAEHPEKITLLFATITRHFGGNDSKTEFKKGRVLDPGQRGRDSPKGNSPDSDGNDRHRLNKVDSRQ